MTMTGLVSNSGPRHKGPSQQPVYSLFQAHHWASFQPCGRLTGSCFACTQACKALMAKARQKALCLQSWAFSKSWKSPKRTPAHHMSGLNLHLVDFTRQRKNTKAKTVPSWSHFWLDGVPRAQSQTCFKLAVIYRDHKMPGREMHQFDRQGLKEKKNRKGP